MQLTFEIQRSSLGYEVWPKDQGNYAMEYIGFYPTHDIAKAVGNAYIQGFADGVWHGMGETDLATAAMQEILKGVQP